MQKTKNQQTKNHKNIDITKKQNIYILENTY